MSPFRVPATGGTPIGENGIEQQGAGDDGLAVPAETLRRWMRQAGRWPRQRRRKPYRQRRERKAHFGELVQLDGSFPAWLEERGPRGCLMHMVDDATTTALGRFSEEETIWAAAGVLRGWIERYGVPRALYTDWKNVYVRPPNAQERRSGEPAVTQFGRMCGKLGLRIIAASSPQAKGRVTRAWYPSGSAGEEVAAGWDRQLRAGQRVSRGALSCRAQPAIRAAGRGRSRLSPQTTHRSANRRSVLSGGRTGGK